MSAASGSPAKPTSSKSISKELSKATSKKSDSKVKAAAKPRAPKTKTDGRPSWKDIIKECIAVNKGDARQGVSRNTIKRYAEEAYKIDMTGLNISQLNRAITSGAEGGIFLLPKGPSGKVKLASKAKPLTSASKENSKPTTAKKVAAPPLVKKTAAAPKKALVGKAKPTTTTKKTTAPSRRGAVKKAITRGKPAGKAESAATRKAPAKKAVSAKKT